MPKNIPTKKLGLRTADIPGSWFEDKFSQFYTVHPCRALPIRFFDIPGKSYNTFDFGSIIESLPALSPLKDGWTYTVKAYFWPYRLGLPQLRKNIQFSSNYKVDDVEFPYLEVEGRVINFDPNAVVQDSKGFTNFVDAILRGSVWERLGYSPCEFYSGQTLNAPYYRRLAVESYQDFSASTGHDWATHLPLLPYLAYCDIWDYAEYNKQDKMIPVVAETFSFETKTLESEIKYFDYAKFQDFLNCFRYGHNAPTGFPARQYRITTTDANTERTHTYLYGPYGATQLPEVVQNYPIFTRLVKSFTQSPRRSSAAPFDGGINGRDMRFVWPYLTNSISKVGLLPTTLYGDKFTTWFSDENIQKLEQYIVTAGMTLTQLRQTNNNMYLEMLSSISGDKYVDILSYVYDSDLELKDHPIFVGSDSISFNMIDVLNQSQGSYGERNESLGSTASKAYVSNNGKPIKGKPIKFKAKEPGLLMFYGVLTPRVRYFQGEDRFLTKTQYASLWHPQYSSQGFADVMSGELYKTVAGQPLFDSDDYANIWTNTGPFISDKRSVSRVPVGWEYMIHESRASGGATLPWYRTWSLVRDFNDFVPESDSVMDSPFFAQSLPSVEVLRSTYGNEDSFNYNFANVGQDAENFQVLTEFHYSRYLPMSKNLLKRDL